MTNPYRAMCSDLIDALDAGIPAGRIRMSPLADRARALLAQPEPEGPTDDKLMDIARATDLVYYMGKGCGFASPYQEGTDITAEVLAFARAVLARARALLDQPEPVAPTDQEIEEWADACPEAPLEEMDPEVHGWRRCFTAKEFGETIRAAIARWGHPTPQPVAVSERLPVPEDCTTNPRTSQGQWCWGWVQHGLAPYSGRWRMMRREWITDEATHWLPANALPLPAGEGAS